MCAKSIGSNLCTLSFVNEVGKKRKTRVYNIPPNGKLNHRREEEELIPFCCLDLKKQPRSFSSFKFLASTITIQEITSTTTFMQVNTSSFNMSMQKLIGASNLDLETFPITMASM